MVATLILLRHGESEWNRANLFTGWVDADLTAKGEAEARAAAGAMADAGVEPTVLHTSLQTRAIRTAQLALEGMGRLWIPVRRSWRLNERHYGDLTGKDKAQTAQEFGADQVKTWRRSYTTPPPPISSGNAHNPNGDARYAHLPPELLPASECLRDVLERTLPWWYDGIVPDLQAGHTVLVAAHGNSLRALVKHLDDISDEAITELNLPTGVPIRYEIGHDMRPTTTLAVTDRFLGDADAARAAAEAVARQAG